MTSRLLRVIITNKRSFATSSISYGKKNFRKFTWINRGTQQHKEEQRLNPDPRYTPDYGVRKVLHTMDGRCVLETIPELVVPNLDGFNLKPYVSYITTDAPNAEFTAKDLFFEVYAEKIKDDFINGKLDENGISVSPSENELLTPEQAELRARQTGGDLFTEDVDVSDRIQVTRNYYL